MADPGPTGPSDASSGFGHLAERALRLGWSERRPLAIWRSPGAAAPQGLISLGAATRGPAIAPGRRRPAFAMGAFASEAGTCDLIEADLLVAPGRLDAVAGDGNVGSSPATPDQVAFLARAGDLRETSPRLGLINAPGGTEVPNLATETSYKALVAEAVAAVRSGALGKVVASRTTAKPLAAGFDGLAFFERLCERYPAAFVCMVVLPDRGLWFTATPETLLRLDEAGLTTMALAGTQAAGPDVRLEDVTWSAKLVEEQALVTRFIRDAIADAGLAAVVEGQPRTVRAGNLVHRRTDFAVPRGPGHGDATFDAQAAELLARLHPTSAVCGMPRAAAQAFLRDHEGYARGFYAGFLGPVGPGRASLYVNLRSAEIVGDTAYLYVGAGITGESRPEDEWRETVEKSRTLGAVLDDL